MHPSYIVSLSSVLLKLIQFRLLYIVYAAGLAPETTFRKKVLYNILYKLLQLFWPVEKYLCFKRHVGPIVQKGHIVNTFLSLALAFSREEETDVILHNRLYTPSIHTFIHPSIHPLHEINNIHFMKSTRLHIKYREDKIFALGSRDNDYVATMILRDGEAKDNVYKHSKKKGLRNQPWYTVLRDWDVLCNSLEEENTKARRGGREKKNVHKVSHKCMYSIFKFQ